MNLVGKPYGVVTLHRPANVDHEPVLGALVRQLLQISSRLPLVFAVHPRTRKNLQEFGLLATLEATPGITLTEPLGYIQFMNQVTGAAAVVTDSGCVQEESTYLGIPCLTLRENTERPIRVTEGSQSSGAGHRPAGLAADRSRRHVEPRLSAGSVGWQHRNLLRGSAGAAFGHRLRGPVWASVAETGTADVRGGRPDWFPQPA
jgi:UDP-N-acetylglucosamine 2-epimerase